MNATPFRVAARYLLAWATVVFFVALLTFIFSFLGTIMCAVLGGMMLGAARLGRWHNLLASCIFPGTMFGIFRTARSEVPGWQLLALMALCFGAFWLTYLVAYYLIFYEHKGQSAAPRTQRRPTPGTTAPPPLEALNLEALQGKWSCVAGGVNGSRTCKTMAIERGELVLSVADAKGQVSRRARAQIKLLDSNPLPTVMLGSPSAEAVDFLISI